MLTIEEAIEKFQYELPKEIQLSCQAPEFSQALQELERTYGLDLSSSLIHFAIGEIEFGKIDAYLMAEFDLDAERAKKLAKDLEEKVFKPLAERLDFLNESPNKAMTLLQEKNYIERVFKYSLLRELDSDPLIAAAVNRRLFFILARDPDFHRRLEQVLYENEELVTAKNITVDAQELKPTVGNWIKDFIAHYGSQSYDSVSLSAFLVNSENARHLSDTEREGLSLVLKVYSNIKFFPDSMPDDESGETWQIIPYEDEDKIMEEISRQAAALPDAPVKKTIEQKPLASVQAKTPLKPTAAAQPKIQPQPIAATVPETQELLELKNEALQYPVGSLQRSAIEEEIKRLSS